MALKISSMDSEERIKVALWTFKVARLAERRCNGISEGEDKVVS